MGIGVLYSLELSFMYTLQRSGTNSSILKHYNKDHHSLIMLKYFNLTSVIVSFNKGKGEICGISQISEG